MKTSTDIKGKYTKKGFGINYNSGTASSGLSIRMYQISNNQGRG